MPQQQSQAHEIRQLARYHPAPLHFGASVRSEALARCLAAIREFVAYVRASEPGTLRYEA